MLVHIRSTPFVAALLATMLLTIASRAAAGPDDLPPTDPGALQASPLSSTAVQLAWGPSEDDRRVKHYEVRVDGSLYAYSGATDYVVTNLDPETTYQFAVRASDGRNVSGDVEAVATTLSPSDPPTGDGGGGDGSGHPGKGNGKPGRGDGGTTDGGTTDGGTTDGGTTDGGTTDGGTTDGGSSGGGGPTSGPHVGWNLVFADEFDGFGQIDTTSESRRWRFESMSDPLHRAGNTGMDETGHTDVPTWQSARGKRWSAWYDGHQHDNAYRGDGVLVMQGFASDVVDPTRPDDYFDDGTLVQFGSGKLYTTWLDTFSRVWSQEQLQHIADPSAPNHIFKYGYFEARVDFSEMITPGFRLSFWLMPASRNADGTDLVISNAYDSDGDNGVEIDIFEYEYVNESLQDKIILALHGGGAGGDGEVFDVTTIGTSLRSGFHTVGLLWEPDRLVWYIDGETVKEIVDPALIPDVYSYLVLSREMNSGVKRTGVDYVGSGDVLEVLPYRPRDPGLYGRNVWKYRDRLDADRALIDYIKVWQAP